MTDNVFIEKKSFGESIIAEASGIMHINKEDCTPILLASLDELTQRERVMLELVTNYLCYVRGLKEDEVVPREQLKKNTGLESKVLAARLSELHKLGQIRKTKQGDTITTSGLIAFRDLLRKLKRERKGGGQIDK